MAASTRRPIRARTTRAATPQRCRRDPYPSRRGRPRAHREDVAQDATDPGGCSLVRLDRRGMVVALDLEDAEQAVAELDGAGVLAGTERDARAGRRQRAQQGLAVLVGAVLAPHRAE